MRILFSLIIFIVLELAVIHLRTLAWLGFSTTLCFASRNHTLAFNFSLPNLHWFKDTDRDKIDAMDRISDLPPFIIHHIMSYLTPKEVGRTSILSKRWNCLRSSFPILDFIENDLLAIEFDQGYGYEKLLEPADVLRAQRLENFLNFVDASLFRFCKLKISMQIFRLFTVCADVKGFSSLLEKWIGLAVEHDVKELDIGIYTSRDTADAMLNFPQTVFSAKLLTSLKLFGFKLEHPSDTIRFCFLKHLTLSRVRINEHAIQKLTSECPVLESLDFSYCWGMKHFSTSKLLKLKLLSIFASLDELDSVEIGGPSLQTVILEFVEGLTSSVMIHMAGCPCLNELRLTGVPFKDQEFHYLVSKFPLLEHLWVWCCEFLERVRISSNKLKTLHFAGCSQLKAIVVDTPNLLSFKYSNNPILVSPINAPCLRDVSFIYECDLDTCWFVHIKEFLGVSDQIEYLFIDVKSEKISVDLDKFQKKSLSFPCEVENLILRIDTPASEYAALLDGLFSICYPKNLSVRTGSKASNEFIEFVYEEFMYKDTDCCGSCHVKCWRQYLTGVEIDSFYEDEDDDEPVDIEKVMDDWPIFPNGTLMFSLDWCLPVVAENSCS